MVLQDIFVDPTDEENEQDEVAALNGLGLPAGRRRRGSVSSQASVASSHAALARIEHLEQNMAEKEALLRETVQQTTHSAAELATMSAAQIAEDAAKKEQAEREIHAVDVMKAQLEEFKVQALENLDKEGELLSAEQAKLLHEKRASRRPSVASLPVRSRGGVRQPDLTLDLSRSQHAHGVQSEPNTMREAGSAHRFRGTSFSGDSPRDQLPSLPEGISPRRTVSASAILEQFQAEDADMARAISAGGYRDSKRSSAAAAVAGYGSGGLRSASAMGASALSPRFLAAHAADSREDWMNALRKRLHEHEHHLRAHSAKATDLHAHVRHLHTEVAQHHTHSSSGRLSHLDVPRIEYTPRSPSRLMGTGSPLLLEPPRSMSTLSSRSPSRLRF